MVRVLFLVLLGSFWIISGAHYIINLEMSTELRIVRTKIPRESLLLDETLNVRIVSEIPVVAKTQVLLCYVGEERPSYYFASFLVNSKTEKHNYILDSNLSVHKDMQGIWYCTLLFDRDPILFELEVYVTSPNEVSNQAEIATEIGFYSNVVAPTNIYHDKRYSAKIKRDTYGTGARPHNTQSNYKTATEPDTYDYDGSGAEPQIDEDYDGSGAEPQIDEMTSNTNKRNYGYGTEPQNTNYGRNSKRNSPGSGAYGYDAEPQIDELTSNTNKRNYGYGTEPQNTRYGRNSKRNSPGSGAYGYDQEPQVYKPASNTNKRNYGYGAEPQNTRYGTNSRRNSPGSGPYVFMIYDAEPQINETFSNTIKRNFGYWAAAPQNTHYDYGTRPQNTRFNGTTSNPKNDGPHPYVDTKNNDGSAVANKMYVFIGIAAGSGILIGTIVGVLCRKKCKTTGVLHFFLHNTPIANEPIVSFTTADPVYEDVYSAKLHVANRPPHPLPFEEREENKQYIHYDTPYDHRCGWRPPPQVATFKK